MSDIHVVQNTFEAWKQAVEAVILSSEECLYCRPSISQGRLRRATRRLRSTGNPAGVIPQT